MIISVTAELIGHSPSGAATERGRSLWSTASMVALLLLPALEILGLTIRFDTRDLAGHSWLGALTENLSAIPQMLAVAATATLIFGGSQTSQAIGALCCFPASHPCRLRWLSAHLLLLLVFVAVTQLFFASDRGASVAWTLCWFGCGVACGGAWTAAVVEPSRWKATGRRIAHPVLIGAIIGTSAWFAGQWAARCWEPLALGTFQLVWLLLTSAGIEVVQDPARFVTGTPVFAVRIAPGCSGYEGMGLAIVFVSTYLWWRRDDHRFPRSFLLIPLAVAFMFLANAVRIAGLILIGHSGWEEFALGGFHSQAGWFAFNVVVLGVVAYARTSRFFRCGDVPTPRDRPATSVPLLMPFVALTVTAMVTRAVLPGFDWLYPLRLVTVLVAVALLRRQYRAEVWSWRWSWTAPGIGVAVYLLWIALEPVTDLGPARLLYDAIRSEGPVLFAFWLMCRIIGSIVTVPLAEELAFRGYLLPWLSVSRGEQSAARWSWAAILISSLAFGALHPGRLLAGTLAGMFFAVAFLRRGLLMDAVLAHATANALVAAHVLLTGDWTLWS